MQHNTTRRVAELDHVLSTCVEVAEQIQVLNILGSVQEALVLHILSGLLLASLDRQDSLIELVVLRRTGPPSTKCSREPFLLSSVRDSKIFSTDLACKPTSEATE
ncbi:hypothetical protein EVAR_83267_1 [Eumeta japonica]|uniref:Uncharacterized protein n=1 Tax=Eumeta variegata TaxID=151549 RepID=A0A4C1X6Y8_EUMVA|nr:hypothetical protein EVAR_83267_1 [Eumeta japonica]